MRQDCFHVKGEILDRVTQADHLLVCLDFDGTLTPFRDNPSLVTLSATMRRALESLNSHANVSLAIISGRERADLFQRVKIPGVIYVGNHGLEISGPGFIFIEPIAASSRPALQAVATDLGQRLQHIPGVLLEDKGLTLTVHYRQVAQKHGEDVRNAVHAALANSPHPFQLTSGAKIYEIRPRTYWNKGTALLCLIEHLGQLNPLTIYMGDDDTDEDAFAALPDGLTIKIGDSSNTQANYQLDSPAEVQSFLEWLNRILRQQPSLVP